jgi:hypothetical protein
MARLFLRHLLTEESVKSHPPQNNVSVAEAQIQKTATTLQMMIHPAMKMTKEILHRACQ